MAKNINSASRLHDILIQTVDSNKNATALAIWSSVFQIQDDVDARKALIVSERLRWLHQELDILRSQMNNAPISEGLYSAAFNNIEQAISTLLLSTTWNNGVQYLKPEYLVALNFCSEILPDEESLIDPETLKEIRDMVQELEDMLASSNLPESLVSLIRHHIELINRALDQYPIIGATAFREAARTALGELVEARDIVKENNQAEEVNKLGSLWGKLNSTADIALKADKLSQLASKAWTFLENVLPSIPL
jgi:hypothetical protein